jgi:phage/plasmid primase-like uncharacterized protein
MPNDAHHLAMALAERAEEFCRHYLPHGRRRGHYWQVGDAQDNPGQSLRVRLKGPSSGPGAAGKWIDAARPDDHGDLIDLIRASKGISLKEALAEARAFLGRPALPLAPPQPRPPRATGSPAQRLFAAGKAVTGSLAETYLRSRGLAVPASCTALRFHPRCYVQHEPGKTESWPALLAAATANDGSITGLHRTYLARDGSGKAPFNEPKRAMGEILGSMIRLTVSASDSLIIGEGLETMLTIACLLPHMPTAAAVSAGHLPGVILPPGLTRLYIARDNDAGGRAAALALKRRAQDAGILVRYLPALTKDWNSDLTHCGARATRSRLQARLHPADDAPAASAAA